MLFDLNKALPTLSARRYDVCVVGSGPAGMTVARELAAGGQSVALLEAGSFERSERSQAIYKGQETGLKTWSAIESCRLRYFGGTSNHWSGQCGVLDAWSFAAARHHDLPGWPIERQELMSYLPRALDVLDLGQVDFEPKPIVSKRPSRFESTTVHMSRPTRIGPKYRSEVVESNRIDLYLNANLIELQIDAPTAGLPRVSAGIVRNYADGSPAQVKASRFVLAMGSIENARLLLNSNRQVKAGLGNDNDWVGRCFMEHLNVQIGRFIVSDAAFFKANVLLFSPREELMRKHRMSSGTLALAPDYLPPRYTGRLGGIKEFLRDEACRFETLREYTRRFADYDCGGEGIITSLIEQVPDRNSRVTLNSETDEFGERRAHLNWVINDIDRRTIRTMGLELAHELLNLDVARVKLSKFITDPEASIELVNHCHQMGTTRMSKDPKFGVVDPDCRVHSLANLYIAGSSVFPTGGGINPTLTVVMQSLRLGQHLRSMPSVA